ncbi:amidohydrolase family protein [Modestobacter sp. I12A-02628]|uniref:Amidohydrolase n=1 Tax=Goekera deserti TaxID=2497753 RepID=A0A7K3WAA3_9ACTN|nr:amidohydrolase family protein [Goekera deserti]MPQ99112.1 amidohydrolase family protein [Goekera deserti]NDI47446.1 amidohydrolase family protein [Goekera deserti]NEL53257.1 amidohydrolase [Goekera deserti]
MTVVDVHAHAIIGDVEAVVAGQPGLDAAKALDARRNGGASLAVSGRMVGERIPLLTQVDARLAAMDAQGVDVQVVSPSPSHYHYWAEPDLARVVCTTANRSIAALVAEEPERFVGLGLVPLQHPDLCVELLEDAVLGCGLAGVEISSHAPGGGAAGDRTVELSDERLEPFWARAAELGAVVFLHPFGCTLDERLDRWYLSNTVGQPVENAVALSHLVFAGVLDRHPGLRLVAAHGGGYLPTFLGRSDHAWTVRPEARDCAELPSSYLRRLWFDSLVHTPEALRALVEAVGADRVLLGSDFPFDMGVPDPVQRLQAAGLGADAEHAISGGTAAELGLVPTHTTPAPTLEGTPR